MCMRLVQFYVVDLVLTSTKRNVGYHKNIKMSVDEASHFPLKDAFTPVSGVCRLHNADATVLSIYARREAMNISKSPSS